MKQNNNLGTPFSNDPKLHNRIGNICTDPQSLSSKSFENAEEFYRASKLLLPFQPNMLIVVFSNLSFSCELFLKSILYKFNGNKVHGHKLYDLYKQLPCDIREEIRTNTKFLYEKAENFDLFFEEISDTFVFTRYWHERNLHCNSIELFTLVESIRTSALYLYNEQIRLSNESTMKELEIYKEDNKNNNLICWINYSNDYNDSINTVAELIIAQMPNSLKRDFTEFECSNHRNEYFDMSIKMSFTRENYWHDHEYGYITFLSKKILEEYQFSYSGFRTTGRSFSLKKELK